ncbi:MAG: ABC transporter permease [Oscillospiraceae bacterium]|nr:ABC transporter permease [Oscillospiraceae bacterium]
MKKGFYLRLALDGMRKNRRLYLPYLLTCAGMVMMFYILYSLAYSPAVRNMRGGSTMAMILILGTVVMAIFALLFLLYTNSFLARRRNREFGLYNILGMNKGNLGRILLWETLLSALVSLLAGLACGLLFAKLAELFLAHMAGETVGYALTVEPRSILAAVLFFGVIFAVLLIVSLARVGISKPLDLLKSEAAGEKPPRANWILALLGLLILGAAYWLAVSIEAPLTALTVFFIAVVMVILATYLLFIAGSVALCKLLQKNKSYYYRSDHFVSVSSMTFRMKRNGAGLASICILATMVLVMLATTSCLYFGGENALRGECPYDVSFSLYCDHPEDCGPEAPERISELAHTLSGGREKDLTVYTLSGVSGLFRDGVLEMDGYSRFADLTSSASVLEKIRTVYLTPLSEYNRLMGTDYALEDGEALVWSSKKAYAYETLTFKGCEPIRIRGSVKDLPFRVPASETLVTMYCLIVPDWTARAAELHDFTAGLEDPLIKSDTLQLCSFDLPGVPDEEQIRITEEIVQSALDEQREAGLSFSTMSYKTRAANRTDFFSMYGSLFFLGIVLSIVFVAAAALIIYYKQLSEGYEDQRRFGIMQKVGMTVKEIKSAVNAQVLTVFFAPLLLAGLHLAFAFPFLHKIVRLFGVLNTPLLILTSVICFLAFALFYVFVYRSTARTYVAIVSAGEEGR